MGFDTDGNIICSGEGVGADCTLPRRIYPGADLSNCDLQYFYLINRDLRNTNFTGANLFGVNFRQTLLRNANLSNTDLRKALFVNAEITDTDLRKANLTGPPPPMLT